MKHNINKVSRGLKNEAARLDRRLKKLAGNRVSFSLFVWTDGRAQYISNSSDRAEIKQVIQNIIDGWDTGMPDIPAHKLQ